VILMIVYFLVSVVNSSVQEYLVKKDEEAVEKLKKKVQGKSN